MRQAEPIATSCTSRDQELVRKAREYESKNDPDGLTELPRQTATVQDAVKRELYDLQQHDSRMDDYADDADDFRGDGPWRDLASTVAQTAQTSFGLWRKSYESAKSSCANLERGLDHPTIKEILANLSNSAGGRKAIIEQLNKDARSLASTLAGVSEDSGLGSVQQAKALLQSIERGIESLGRTATTDKETRVILEKWPEGIRQLKEAIDDLEDLKVHQHDMDPLPERCLAKEREIQEAIARNGSDTDGIDDLPKLADAIAQPVVAGLDKAKDRMREESDDLQRAKAISASEGPWRDVTAAEQRDADETFKTFEDSFKKTEQACANIVKGKDAPAVKEATERLRRGATDGSSTLERSVDAWVVAARATYITDCDAKRQMWEAECGSDREPSGEDSDVDAQEISRRVEGEMRDRMKPLLERLPELQQQVDVLLAKRETKAQAAPLAAKLKTERQRLERLSESGRWKGSNRPYNQLATSYGKEQHVRMHKDFSCQLPLDPTRPLKFEGAEHLYPDCIIVTDNSCEIIEFKPESKKGRRDAARQLASYRKTVPEYYQKHLDNKSNPDPEYGGSKFLARIVAAGCAGSDGKGSIRFTTPDPGNAYYHMCAQPYECIEPN
ncbi:MAG: hypothetical protein IPL61_06855 [Myxococcales bacterium]|nr:hypothetical protein [Myxococcales bacterium]